MPEVENYTKEKRTIDLIKANGFSLLLLVIVGVLYITPYYLVWFVGLSPRDFFVHFSENWNLTIAILVLPILILGIVLHELFHGIVWARFAKDGFRSIKFGVMWEMLTPYCHCKEPLTVKQYILGAAMPCIILGVVPAVLAIVLGSFVLLLFGLFFTATAAGDIMIIYLLRKEKKIVSY